MPINNQPGDQEQQEAAIIADNWKQAGVAAEIRRVTPQELRDGEMRSKYPAVAYERRALALDNMVWTIAEISRPENRWTGSNRNGWANTTFDDLWKRVLGSIDEREREGLLIQALSIMQDDAYVTLTHLQASVMCYDSALTGPTEPSSVGPATTWNVFQWRWTP
jgi:ABC-type transport system substrate-binding protein